MTSEFLSKSKKLLFAISFAILALGIFVIFYSPVVFQEGNPWPQIKGIVQLNFRDRDIVKLDIGENKYITKSDNPEIVKSFMKGRGYEFTEQMGSGYFFRSGLEKSAVAVHRYYSRYYSLWSISENQIAKDATLAERSQRCLTRNDVVSRAECGALLDTISNYDDCVNAGFPVVKSDPPRCSTVDGRNFTREANGDWNMALAALKNCEVKSVFQAHSRQVTLGLRNGEKLIVYEPQIDNVMKVVADLKGDCGNVIMATE